VEEEAAARRFMSTMYLPSPSASADPAGQGDAGSDLGLGLDGKDLESKLLY